MKQSSSRNKITGNDVTSTVQPNDSIQHITLRKVIIIV